MTCGCSRAMRATDSRRNCATCTRATRRANRYSRRGETGGFLLAQRMAKKPALAIFVNNDGEVLALPAAQIEEMTAGKGQNLFGIPGKKSADRDEYLVAMAAVAPGEVLTIYSGNSAPMKLKFEELKQFQDRKGQRRQRFSRAYKQIDRLEVSPA